MKTRPWIRITDLSNPTDLNAETVISAASSVLFALSGQKYGGEQRTTERYVCEPTGAPVGCAWQPEVGGWWNPAVGMYTYVFPKVHRPLVPGGSFRLRSGPVRSLESVSIAGVVQDPATYELLDGQIVSPLTPWSICDGVEVTYTFGVDPPALGQLAAKRLANELLAALSGGACALPTNVTSVTREGLSLEIFDPQDFFDKGHTGLYEVDLFIAISNPGRAKKRPKVFSPDIPRGYRRS